MKTIEYKVSFEKMISRLPGLFAYLDSDDFGEVSLHKAKDTDDTTHLYRHQFRRGEGSLRRQGFVAVFLHGDYDAVADDGRRVYHCQ